ncbi:MAG: hypothetical protein AB2598_17105 [Candidatus Thiodiazotropha sp.]
MSPLSCPRVSLIDLKWSISKVINVIGIPERWFWEIAWRKKSIPVWNG